MCKTGIKKFLLFCLVALVAAGGYLYYDFWQFCDTSVPVFAYHRVGNKGDLYSVPEEEFSEQMRFLHDCGYSTLTLAEYARARSEHKVLHKTIVLTFDDGYSDNLTAAVPIMKPWGYRGTVYIAVKFAGWPGYLDWQQTMDMMTAGWEIGSHTYNHVQLGMLPLQKVESELRDSYNYIFREYPSKIGMTLCYPNGSYNEEVCKAVEAAGYRAAVTGMVGVNTSKTPLYALRRINVFNNGKGLQGYKRKLLRAYLISWGETYGIDVFKLWKAMRTAK